MCCDCLTPQAVHRMERPSSSSARTGSRGDSVLFFPLIHFYPLVPFFSLVPFLLLLRAGEGAGAREMMGHCPEGMER